VQDPKNPAHLINHDNDYLHYKDDWYILDYENDDFVLVYYKGSNDAWDGYGGAFLYTRSPSVRPELVPRLEAAMERTNGYKVICVWLCCISVVSSCLVVSRFSPYNASRFLFPDPIVCLLSHAPRNSQHSPHSCFCHSNAPKQSGRISRRRIILVKRRRKVRLCSERSSPVSC
jgi:hypothetical protein